MKITPNFSMWFGIWTSILIAIAGGTVSLTNLIPAGYESRVIAWAAFLAFVNNTILTGMHAYSSAGPGPLAPPPTIKEAQAVMNAAHDAANN